MAHHRETSNVLDVSVQTETPSEIV